MYLIKDVSPREFYKRKEHMDYQAAQTILLIWTNFSVETKPYTILKTADQDSEYLQQAVKDHFYSQNLVWWPYKE